MVMLKLEKFTCDTSCVFLIYSREVVLL